MTSGHLTGQALRHCAGRVCVAFAGEEMFASAHTAGQRFVEFRLDSLPNPSAALGQLRDWIAAHPGVTAIATCRRAANGGAFTGTAEEQVNLLAEAARAGCILTDIEVETAEALGEAALWTLRAAGAAVILSWHNFTATPPLEPILNRMRLYTPDFYKVVPTAQSLRDSLRLIDLLETHSATGNLIAMSMGIKGVLTRVLGPRFGSTFTFAAANGTAGTAPGQISAQDIQDLYRMDSITDKTAIYAVAGLPIGGSKSPLMQNTAFAATAIDAVYLPLETADATELLEVADRLNLRGISITMPLKEAVMPLLTHTDESVRAIGACNTLLRYADGALAGFNTDIAGITGPLEHHINLKGARVLVLGAGGAARAAVYGLHRAGAHISILNRTVAKAEILALEFGARVQSHEQLAQARFDIILNATPYGMRSQVYDAPIQAEEMNCDIFFDLVYNPIETPLVKVAMDRGIRVIPGFAMFVEQGVRQFNMWTEKLAPEGDMLRSVMDTLEAH